MSNEVYGPETQASIYEWGQVTFDQPSPLSIMSRLQVEMAELCDLLVRRTELYHGINSTFRREQMVQYRRDIEAVEAKLRGECADVLVILMQVAQSVGVELEQAMQEKMKINRARRWEKLEGGRFQHVNGT